jgi:SAM-dependent methyltransferase
VSGVLARMREARVIRPELMDTDVRDYAEFEECLRQLEGLNRATFAYHPTLDWLERTLERVGKDRVVSILDVGCGHGDMLRRIQRWGEARGRRFRMTGVDLSPLARRAAEKATAPGLPIEFETGNVFDIEDDLRFDIVLSAIFTHHLDDDGVVDFLRWMERHALLGWFINDLHRHAVPYLFLKTLFGIGRFNRLVRHDGPVSVGRAFKRGDWERLLAAAGFPPAAVEIGWHVPFRWGVGRVK